MTQSIIFGKYQHYKGGEYIALTTVTHSESCDAMVLYAPLYGDSGLWLRPYAMFFETVTINDEVIPRFAFLGEPSLDELEKVKGFFPDFFKQSDTDFKQEPQEQHNQHSKSINTQTREAK